MRWNDMVMLGLPRLRTNVMKIRHRNTQDVLSSVTISGGVAGMQPGRYTGAGRA